MWDFNKIFNFKFGKIYLDKIIVFFIIIAMITGVYLFNYRSNSDAKSILKSISYFPVFIIYAIYLPKLFFVDVSKFELFLSFVMSLGLINAIIGWLSILLGLQQSSMYSTFLIGIFNHPNASGFAFSLTIPILVYKFFFRNMKKNLFFALIFIYSISLLFTFSRAAYIATGVAVLFLSYYKSKKIFIYMVAVLTVLVLTVVVDFTAVKGGVSSFSRVLLFITAIDMITADTFHFLWGYGIINFYDTFLTDKLFVGSVEIVADPHNLILLLGIQFGMILTLLVILYYVVVLFNAGRRLRKYPIDNHHRNLYVLCFSVVISLLVQNMFEDIIVYPEYYFMPLFLIYTGFLVKSLRINKFSEI
jgi:hypothetical protein